MQRFMPKHHPLAELAPRDVVARAIAHELEVSRLADPFVYLDLTHLDPSHLATRFPRIHSTCLQYNIDIGTDLIPVRPAAHYAMGGVRTDLHARTSLPGLYAAGETACTGVHGANRLASNSLLEGLVYGARAGVTIREETPCAPAKSNHVPSKTCKVAAENPATREGRGAEEFIRAVRDLAWKNIGIVRSGSGLREASEQLEKWRSCLPAMTGRRHCEANNIFQTALLIARSALARQESRGAHYRLDYPSHNDARFKKHSIVHGESIRFE
jgi:L-aspartate oxidase